MKCPNCQFDNPDDSRFCSMCAAILHPSEETIQSNLDTDDQSPKTFAPGTTFSGRFQIIEQLENGGFGKAYRVIDEKLNEEVVLRVIQPEIAADEKTLEQFREELKTARQLVHKNISRVYHISEAKGIHYFTMEYASGKDLKSMIRMTKQLSVKTALNIATQVCEGLAEAHRIGVSHGDLKSSNIMIDKHGNARIKDFGIGRSLKEKEINGFGFITGTPEYMSPEQAETKEVGQSSDIYSFGVILYEMVTGQVPFDGKTPLSIILKHKSEAPRDPRDLNSQIPEDLSRLILKCMQKDKKKRYQNIDEVLSELSRIKTGIPTTTTTITLEKKPITPKATKLSLKRHWVMLAALFVVIVGVGITLAYFNSGNPKPAPAAKMLVILPFDNLGIPEDEYFADGMTDEVTSRLSALKGINVISRTSASRYKNSDKTIKQLGRELGVDYVLEGAVRWDRNNGDKGRVRINTQLIRVADDTHLWSETYDRVIQDIFSVQSEIAEQVAKQLDLTVLTPEREAMYAKPTQNLEAYDLYLRAIEHEDKGWEYSYEQEFELAIEMLDKATEIDPDFALAFVRKSIIHSRVYFFGIDRTDERLSRSQKAVERALEIQPDLPDAHMALAFYYYWGLLDYDRAQEIFISVQKAFPNLSPELLGFIQRRQGKWEQSLEMMEKAFRLNPRYSHLAYEIGLSYLAMRRYEQAEEWFDRALSINPNLLNPQIAKAAICVLSKGDTKEARAILATLPQHRLTDHMWLILDMLEHNYQNVLDRLDSLPYDSYQEQHSYFQKNLAYASVYLAKRDYSAMKTKGESASIELEKAVQIHHGDPRFHAALGLAYAYLGRKNESIQEGTRAVNLYPVSKDAALGPVYILNLARIYYITGEYDLAIDQLEYLLSIPSCEFLWQLVSIPLLQIDPQWDNLRDYPRFQRLLK